MTSSFLTASVERAEAALAMMALGPASPQARRKVEAAEDRYRRQPMPIETAAGGPDMWDWSFSRLADESLSKIHDTRHVHGDGGAFVSGKWVDIEDCAEHYHVDNPSHNKVRCGACPRSCTRHTSAKPDGSYDIIIIGAGCIGSAIARELSKTKASVLVLEGADDVTQGATKGNSGIIHAGFDDKPGTNRAKYCWTGNQMFPQLDAELHFGFEKAGSLVIAREEDDIALLHELMERGKKNGVQNLRIIDKDELHLIEPELDKRCCAALLAPDAGTITPYEYTIALAENAADVRPPVSMSGPLGYAFCRLTPCLSLTNTSPNRHPCAQNGVEFRMRREVVSIDHSKATEEGGHFELSVKHWEPPEYTHPSTVASTAGGNDKTVATGEAGGRRSPPYPVPKEDDTEPPYAYSPSPGTVFGGEVTNETYRARFIINAAGCASDKISAMVGDTSWHVKPRMGEYILLNKNQGHKTKHILFPCPHPVFGKGCLVQTTLWGNLILGPTARDTMKKSEVTGKYEKDMDVANEPADNIMGYILSKAQALIPSFDAGQVIHTFAGVRAKNTTGDWIIGPVDGVPGFINAASIDSPGIAASPAIAVDIVRMLGQAGAPVFEKDPTFNPNRAPSIVPKFGNRNLKYSRADFWKVKDPKQNVVCKCEKVTEQEIIDACRRSLPIDSTQAIRKRTRAGMGHCQGDPENYDCESRVAQIIARETGLAYEQVGRRPWPGSSMMPKRIFDDDDKHHLRKLSDPSKDWPLHGAAA